MDDSAEDVLQIGFTATTGPFGSRNYDFKFRAMEVDDGIFLEFYLSSEPGFISSLAKLYLATVGSSKIGFSTTGTDRNGKTRYVKGQRGGAERNIVRYLLSVQAYFDTLEQASGPDGYLKRLERWYDLTDVHKKQLFELERDVYIEIKQKERINQHILIESIANHKEPDYNTEKTK